VKAYERAWADRLDELDAVVQELENEEEGRGSDE
jgi:hypothetical protein